ncbi:MAG: polysaccharide biosynthesis C-terminal domain-containing protein [Flavobacterium sp.]|nr:polysaccharide biosynthesis C-terminal domain-containing protein [Flavobacterium sp.]
MATIRKQAIISGLLMYTGFAIGAFNIFFFTKSLKDVFGLTRAFMDYGQSMFAIGSLGMVSVVYKFHPYYKDHLTNKKNDLLTWSLIISLLGFAIVCALGIVFESDFTSQFKLKSPLFVDYYYWVFLFGFGILLFGIFESFSQSINRSVATTFFKEIFIRVLTTIIILLYYFKLINFNTFIYLFASTYLVIAILLIIYLVQQNEIHLNFQFSKVTRRLWRKILSLQSFYYSATIIAVLKDTVDGMLITILLGTPDLGIFALSQYLASLVQAPQRTMLNVSVGVISKAWKDKDLKEINRVYSRSCINMFIMSAFVYGNVVLNTEEAIDVFDIDPQFLQGIEAMIVLGLMRLIDAGTGVNNIVIQTSNRWKFDFYSGLILLALIMPLNYFLIKQYGIIGSAYAQLISFIIYNAIRFEFIRRVFKMQPFNSKTLYSILLAVSAFAIAYFVGTYLNSWAAIFVRGIIFSGLMISGVFACKLTPDAHQLLEKWLPKKDRNTDNGD